MEASDCFLYFLPEELLREFEVCFFFTSPVSGGAAVGDGGNLFFCSRWVSTSDHQSGQVFLFVWGQPTLGD